MSEFRGKVALITGSSSINGEAIALKFSQLGANCVITGRDEIKISKVVEKCQNEASDCCVKVIGVRVDLTLDEDIKRLVETIAEEFGRIDILVTNAGLSGVGNINSPDYIAIFDDVFALKVRSIQVLAKLVAPYLVVSKGAFINVSSINSEKPHSRSTALYMAECAMDAFTKCLAQDLGPKGVKCNTVLPAIVSLNKNQNICPIECSGSKSAECCTTKQSCALSRNCEPEDVAELVVFLSSTKASFINGAVIPVDGGYSVRPLLN